MNDDDKNSVMALENFLKKTKGNKIEIKQPMKIKYQDIFSDDEKENTLDNIELKKTKSKERLKSIKHPTAKFNKIKKYNVVKESIVFQELDSKKSILNISNTRDEFNNLLYNTMINSNTINSNQNVILTKKTEYLRKKSTINFDELYESKLKNVRNIYIFLILKNNRMKYKNYY